jgi:hypothetical protein
MTWPGAAQQATSRGRRSITDSNKVQASTYSGSPGSNSPPRSRKLSSCSHALPRHGHAATARPVWYAERGAERHRRSALARGRSGVGVDLKRVVGIDHPQPAVLAARSVTGEKRPTRHKPTRRDRVVPAEVPGVVCQPPRHPNSAADITRGTAPTERPLARREGAVRVTEPRSGPCESLPRLDRLLAAKRRLKAPARLPPADPARAALPAATRSSTVSSSVAMANPTRV